MVISNQLIKEYRDKIDSFKLQPKISIIVPVYNTKCDLMEKAINSVLNQIYGNWELCIVDDYSTKQDTKKLLLKYFNKDSRIKVIFSNKHEGISKTSNKCIKISTGDYIALLDHDDELTRDALYHIVKEINTYPEVDMIYSDECKIDEKGNKSDFFYKPDWSPELLFNCMYIGHITVYSKRILDIVGYFRKDYDLSQDYDLALRVTEKTEKIRHIEKILYCWRITEGSASMGCKPDARITNINALKDACKRRNINADIIKLPTANRVKLKIDNNIKVSIIIPTDSEENLLQAIQNINEETEYSYYEIVVVTNSNLINKLSNYSYENVVFVEYDKMYNFSNKCNLGVKNSTGEIVIFFNDDVRVLDENWIQNTIEYLYIDGVGGVSPKLIYENRTIQYCGMITGVRRLIGTAFHCLKKNTLTYHRFAQSVRNVSILSGACLAIKKNVFINIGGFDEINTPIRHSDVDLSFKIREQGLRCVYTPYATLLHIGHVTLREKEKKENNNIKDKADTYLLKKWIMYLSDYKYFTKSMIKSLYHDSPEPYRIYRVEKDTLSSDVNCKGDILLVSHDLTNSGAPRMLFNTAKILKSSGYFVTVTSPNDGAMRREYQKNSIPVIIDDLVFKQHHTFEKFAKNFDLVIANTIISWPVVKQLKKYNNCLWWIREAQLIDKLKYIDGLISTLEHANNIISVSDYSTEYIRKYNKKSKIEKIYNGLEDFNNTGKIEITNSKKIFSLVGSVERRKGQKIFIEAIKQIPKNIRNKAEFKIIGRTLDENYKNYIKNISLGIDNIVFIDEVNHQEAISLIKKSDVIVCPSLDDPFPAVMIEGFIFGKVCIASQNTGTKVFIKHGINGFIFENYNSKQLSQIMQKVIGMDKSSMMAIGKNARRVYDNDLNKEVFKEKVLKLIQEKIKLSSM